MLSVSEVAVESFAVAGVSREYLLHHRVCPDKLGDDGKLIVAVAPGAFLEAIPELSDIYGRIIVTRDTNDDDLERMIERIREGQVLPRASLPVTGMLRYTVRCFSRTIGEHFGIHYAREPDRKQRRAGTHEPWRADYSIVTA